MPARPHHFLVRPGLTKQTRSGVVIEPGPIVPLIAIDQLPEWLEIAGLPRRLKVEQTAGLSNLGTIARDQDTYEVKIVQKEELEQESPPNTPKVAGAPEAATTPGQGIANVNTTKHPDTNVGTKGSVNIGRTSGDRDLARLTQLSHQAEHTGVRVAPNTKATTSGAPERSTTTAKSRDSSPSPSGSPYLTLPAQEPSKSTKPDKKAAAPTAGPESSSVALGPSPFCRHWCHHGTCKWGFVCRYRHAMPATVEGLADVGLWDFPAWWTAAMGLTLSSMNGAARGGGSPYDVRVAAARMTMFAGGEKDRVMARMGHGHGHGHRHGHGYGHGYGHGGQRKGREVKAAKEGMTPLDRGKAKVKGSGTTTTLDASPGDKVIDLGIGDKGRGAQTAVKIGEKRQDAACQGQRSVQQPEKLVDV